MNEEISVAPAVEAPKRRPRASRAEMVEWSKRFGESGLGQREFCRQHGLALMTLQRWLAQVERGWPTGAATPVRFAEVKCTGPLDVCERQQHWAAELCRPGGWTVRLAHDVPASMLEQLLRLC